MTPYNLIRDKVVKGTPQRRVTHQDNTLKRSLQFFINKTVPRRRRVHLRCRVWVTHPTRSTEAVVPGLILVPSMIAFKLQGCRIQKAIDCRREDMVLESTMLAGGWASIDTAKRYSQLAVLATTIQSSADRDELLVQWILDGSRTAFFASPS